MPIKSLAVFCGSKNGNNPLYIDHARELGELLARQKIIAIYGGSNRGLMGEFANAVLKNNGHIIGIMPKILSGIEHQHMEVTELLVVEDMHARKKLLYEKCDAALIMAGGYGTLDEFFELLTWNQLSIHDKKIFVLNTSGFYDNLIEHLKRMEDEKFLYGQISDKLTVISNPADLDLS